MSRSPAPTIAPIVEDVEHAAEDAGVSAESVFTVTLRRASSDETYVVCCA